MSGNGQDGATLDATISQAATWVREADALIITAGAGMGVDSGLPDFRGDQGFWTAYPRYRELGVNFVEMANPEHFAADPEFGWGFYGHRLELYRSTEPHAGFGILQRWARELNLPTFVVTSNVDGQFQHAGVPEDSIYEVHGSIHHLQCTAPCSDAIWPCTENVPVDAESMRAQHLPRCPQCGGIARPNILMFGDWNWVAARSEQQEQRLQQFLLDHHAGRMLVIEMGAGEAVPTIRHLGESMAARFNARMLRINPREYSVQRPHLPVPLGACEALRAMDARIAGSDS